MMKHYLKIESQYFDSILSDEKAFEIRKNDRGYKTGDKLILCEIDENNFRTGRQIIAIITYIINGPIYGLKSGFCILSIVCLEKFV